MRSKIARVLTEISKDENLSTCSGSWSAVSSSEASYWRIPCIPPWLLSWTCFPPEVDFTQEEQDVPRRAPGSLRTPKCNKGNPHDRIFNTCMFMSAFTAILIATLLVVIGSSAGGMTAASFWSKQYCSSENDWSLLVTPMKSKQWSREGYVKFGQSCGFLGGGAFILI